MRRRLFTFFSALSVVLCAGVIGLWLVDGGQDLARVAFAPRGCCPSAVHDGRWLPPVRGRVARVATNGDIYVALMPNSGLRVGDVLPVFGKFRGIAAGGEQGMVRIVRASPLSCRVVRLDMSQTLSEGDYVVDVACLAVPYRFVALLLGVSPLLWAVSAVRRVRPVWGRCPRCGYDLRATPGRCPECGRAAGGTG